MTTKVNTSVLDVTNLSGYAANLKVGFANVATRVTGLTSANVTTALGADPVQNANVAGVVTGLTYANILSALGSLAVPRANASIFVTGLTASNVHTALGIYPVSNANGQIDSLGVGMSASGVSGEIRATDNVTAYYFSDASVKTNIKDIPEALIKVTHISGKTFDWTDEYIQERGGEDGYFVQKSDFGVIAQDVQSVFPTAVRVKPNGKLAVDYEKLSALAFAAIRELSLEMQDLKAKMQDLESKINAKP
jgi:hypothetical protein